MRANRLFFLVSLLVWSNAGLGQVPRQEVQPQATPGEIEEKFMTPLMHAAWAGRLDEVRSLLKTGADVNQKEFIGVTALTCAAAAGHLEVVKALLEAGADPNAAGGMSHPRFFISVLRVAMSRRNKNRMEVIDTLIAAGAKVNPPPSFPESVLDVAVQERDLEMIKALLKRRADVNWENEIGTTPLVNALTDGNGPDLEVVRLLLDAGADPNKPRLWVGNDCVSILEYLGNGLKTSRDKSRDEVRRLLRRYGAKKYRVRSDRPCKH